MNFAATKRLLLAPDANLPQRDVLLDAKKMAQFLSTWLCKNGPVSLSKCEIGRVKYRFGANLRVLYELRSGDLELKVAARTFPDGDGAEVCERFRLSNMPYSTPHPVFFHEQLKTVFWTFPNDRKISNLSVLSHIPRDLANLSGRVWTKSRIVAYAPEKCATAQCLSEGGAVLGYAKVFAGNEGRGIFEIYKQLNEMNLRLPRALSYSETHRTLMLEVAPGERVADIQDENAGELYRKFGSAIALLHQVERPNDLKRFKRLDTDRLQQVLRTIENARPDASFQAATLCKKLSDFSFWEGPAVCLHSDVHAKNAIWRDGDLTLIDLDQASGGPAAFDIGSFLAGLQYKECVGQMEAKTRVEISEKFLAGYAEIRTLPTEASLRRHTVAALFGERALRAISRVRVEGLENLSSILARSENILRGGDL